METKLVVFQGKKIRKTLLNGEWWFSVIDVIGVLVESSIPRRYWSDLKRKLSNEGYNELYEKIVQLKLISTDGKAYSTDCRHCRRSCRPSGICSGHCGRGLPPHALLRRTCQAETG